MKWHIQCILVVGNFLLIHLKVLHDIWSRDEVIVKSDSIKLMDGLADLHSNKIPQLHEQCLHYVSHSQERLLCLLDHLKISIKV